MHDRRGSVDVSSNLQGLHLLSASLMPVASQAPPSSFHRHPGFLRGVRMLRMLEEGLAALYSN